MSRNQKRNALTPVLIITVLLWLVCAVCLVMSAAQSRSEQRQAAARVSNAGAVLQEAFTAKTEAVRSANAAEEAQYQTERESYIAALRSAYNAAVAANDTAQQAYYRDLLARNNASPTGTGSVPWPTAANEGWDVLDLSSYAIEKPEQVSLSRQDMLYNGMLLLNQWHTRPADFDDAAPVKVHTYSNSEIRVSKNAVSLLKSAADAWRELLSDAKVQKDYSYFMLESAYRSLDEQKALYDEAVAKLDAADYASETELAAAVFSRHRVSYPGTSEYNSGLSAWPRLYKNGDADLNAKDSNFFESEEGLWLYDHSWEYGLVFRFPLADYPVPGTTDKSYITGISFRMRLFRYVGKGNAAAMHAMDMCLEEYLEYLKLHPHIALYEDGVLRYEIFREYVGDDETVTVTHSGKSGIKSTESMLDNLGCVVTVFEY